jgi:hypothetical protein
MLIEEGVLRERERVKMSGSRRLLLHCPMFSLEFDTFIYKAFPTEEKKNVRTSLLDYPFPIY